VAEGFKLVCYNTATLFSTEAVDYRIDPDRHLAHLSKRRVAGGHGLFSDGSLQERAAWVGC
jgi:hypothetical protein